MAVIGTSIALCIGIGIWVSHAYAIAVVNGNTISISRYYKNYRAATTYYEKIKKSYVDNNKQPPELTAKDIKAQVITNLIVASLVDEAARREIGKDLQGLINERIATYANDATLETASKELYGLSARDFTLEVLIPQAKQDILSGRLYLKNQSFDSWLTDAKKNANVHIFSNDFSWNGERAIAK